MAGTLGVGVSDRVGGVSVSATMPWLVHLLGKGWDEGWGNGGQPEVFHKAVYRRLCQRSGLEMRRFNELVRGVTMGWVSDRGEAGVRGWLQGRGMVVSGSGGEVQRLSMLEAARWVALVSVLSGVEMRGILARDSGRFGGTWVPMVRVPFEGVDDGVRGVVEPMVARVLGVVTGERYLMVRDGGVSVYTARERVPSSPSRSVRR